MIKMKRNNSLFCASVLNIYGTFIYYLLQWLTTVFVVRILGYDENGVFSLCIAFTNIFAFVSRFGERQFQLTDVQEKYSISQYLGVRILTISFSLIATIVVLPFVGFSYKIIICCVAYSIFKSLESLTDFFHTIFQKKQRFMAIAISFTLKGIFPFLAFILFISFFNLFWGIVSMTVSYLFTLLYDYMVCKNEKVSFFVSFKNIFPIIKSCIPIMFFSLVTPYITFISRYVIENIMGETDLGYYSSLSIVVVIMSTLAGAIWEILIPRISILFINGKIGKLVKRIVLIAFSVVLLGALAVLAGEVFGQYFFSLLYGEQILGYMFLLKTMIILSVMLTEMTFLSTVLITMNRRPQMLIGNMIGAIVMTIILPSLVTSNGLIGANYGLMIGLGVQNILLVLIIVFGLLQVKRGRNSETPLNN